MFVSKIKTVFAGVAMMAVSVASLGALSGVAEADGVRVVVPVPFYPVAQFDYGNGYYRTRGGDYYHYDRDRDGWHYGRNHAEGVRWEARHGRR